MTSNPGVPKVRLSEWRERREAAGALDIETDDGQVFRIPPPELWPDAVYEAEGVVDRVRLILGEDTWAQAQAAGLSATALNAIWADRENLTLGEQQASPPS